MKIQNLGGRGEMVTMETDDPLPCSLTYRVDPFLSFGTLSSQTVSDLPAFAVLPLEN